MFESVTRDPHLAERAYHRRLLREKIHRTVTVQKWLPYASFVITSSAPPRDVYTATAQLLAKQLGLREMPYSPSQGQALNTLRMADRVFVIDIRIQPSVAGSSVYTRVRLRPLLHALTTGAFVLIAIAAPLAILWLFMLVPLCAVLLLAVSSTVAINIESYRIRDLIAAALPEKGQHLQVE